MGKGIQEREEIKINGSQNQFERKMTNEKESETERKKGGKRCNYEKYVYATSWCRVSI
jgi:hypothetical protein